jgi:hypothetical protein
VTGAAFYLTGQTARAFIPRRAVTPQRTGAN